MKVLKASQYSTLLIALIFIVLYGSGFVGAKLGLPFTSPLVFLSLRFAVSTVLLFMIAFLIRANWPKSWKQVFHIAISGLLLQATFAVGTWTSMDMGVAPAISALIIALQPLLVAILAAVLMKAQVKLIQWCGLFIGLLGVVFVVGSGAHFNAHYVQGIFMSFLGLLGLSLGNLYQKKFCSTMNIFTGGVIQAFVSGLVCTVLALIFVPYKVHWTAQFVFALSWMSVVISMGAISCLYLLLKRG